MKRKNENGRSMVEMLGVLAVMGLLSIMAFAGFKIALNKHYANEILNEGNKRAVIVAGQIGFNQGSPSLSEFTKNDFTGGTFDQAVTTNSQTEQFGLKVFNVPEAVCNNILNMLDEHTMLRRLASEENILQTIEDCTESEGNYLMVYNEDLTSNDKQRSCQADSECETNCATCVIPDGATKGLCMGECDSKCTPGEDTCGDNECVICDEESNTCKDGCIEIEYLESTGTQYIDTGIIPTLKTDYKVKYASTTATNATDGWSFLGIRSGGVVFDIFYNSGGYGVSFSKWNTWLETPASNRLQQNEPRTFEIQGYDCLLDGELLGTFNISDTQINKAANRSMYLFRTNTTGSSYWYNTTATGRMYYAQFWDNGTLVRDFIPVLDPDGMPAMYDKVEKRLYKNLGSGNFLVPSP